MQSDQISKNQKVCRVCSEFKTWQKQEKKSLKKAAQSAQHEISNSAGKVLETVSQELTISCPPDSEQLGRATWTFLHTTAAYYPKKPSADDIKAAGSLFSSLSQLYPCSDCASHLREEMKRNPPQLNSRNELNEWLCRVHNEVNTRLQKPLFDCSKVLQRWKYGPPDGSCD